MKPSERLKEIEKVKNENGCEGLYNPLQPFTTLYSQEERLARIESMFNDKDEDIEWLINRVKRLTQELEFAVGLMEHCYLKDAQIKLSDIQNIQNVLGEQ